MPHQIIEMDRATDNNLLAETDSSGVASSGNGDDNMDYAEEELVAFRRQMTEFRAALTSSADVAFKHSKQFSLKEKGGSLK
ncbi:unnamed protein product [Dicrocoelium dendriticum]|nr:unnamed protein product [Dicrocoelium dendriticum]